jgi:hypothetical protein
MALVYLVNKPRVSRKIVRWLLLFLEYDFAIIYKPNITHVVEDALLKLLDTMKPIGVLNQTTYASLFIELEWLNDVKDIMIIGQIEGKLYVQHKQKLVRKIEPFTLKNGELYKMGQDNRL